MTMRRTDPYLSGIGIGCVLLAAYGFAGRGLGASGAFASVTAAFSASLLGVERASRSAALAGYLPKGISSPLTDWLVWQLIGVAVGAFVAAWRGGRLRWTTDRGPRVGPRERVGWAVMGGALMGVGARFARGCTSGQALSGGALLSAGSWLFIVTAFAAAYACAPMARRLWL
jgi:uncharacterized membrane protein YedE/YeeE